MNEEELIKKMAKEWDKNGGSTKFWEIKAELKGFQKGKLLQREEDVKEFIEMINSFRDELDRCFRLSLISQVGFEFLDDEVHKLEQSLKGEEKQDE